MSKDTPTSSKTYAFLTSGSPRMTSESLWQYNMRKLLTIKSLDDLKAESENSTMSRCLGPFELTMLGIGGSVGAGIFVLTGEFNKLLHNTIKINIIKSQ